MFDVNESITFNIFEGLCNNTILDVTKNMRLYLRRPVFSHDQFYLTISFKSSKKKMIKKY
ncbi:hypothetical protein Lal_00016496 [Lupinus albus]|nr:hypothetical protein Lal_00016496 [Lupinus albus]